MDYLLLPSTVLFALSAAGIGLLFGGYPLILWLAALAQRPVAKGTSSPRIAVGKVSLLVAARNAERLIDEKVRNSLELSLPGGEIELVVVSDGSGDRTANLLASFADARLKTMHFDEHQGKARALNAGMRYCTGDIIVFSDVDALLRPDALEKLVGPYADKTIGGVCGQRVIAPEKSGMHEAQRGYIAFDSWIKKLETRLGSITSNDGKLYSIRRELFETIPDAVTDDLFVCLSVVRQRRRFVFEPAAVAYIPAPSRNPMHELIRRKRIVSTSLHCISLQRSLLNPLRFGRYAFGLFVNKLLRRLLPVLLVLLFLSSAALASHSTWLGGFLLLQCGFYLLAVACPLGACRLARPHRLRTASLLAFYFVLGNLGNLLGLLAFLRGCYVVKWDPVKAG